MKSKMIAQAATPLEGIRAVAHGMLDIADGDCSCPRGCMAINTLVELAPYDAEVQEVMNDHIQRMRSSFAEVVARGQEAGQIRTDKSAAEITALMMTFMLGLGTSLRGHLSKDDAHKLLDAQFEAVV